MAQAALKDTSVEEFEAKQQGGGPRKRNAPAGSITCERPSGKKAPSAVFTRRA